MNKCIYCNSKITSPNKKLMINDDKEHKIQTCSEECRDKMDKFLKKKFFYKVVSKLELVLGLTGVGLFIIKFVLKADLMLPIEIVLGLDGLLMILLPEAGFRYDRESLGLDKFKMQSRATGGVILIMLFFVLFMGQGK